MRGRGILAGVVVAFVLSGTPVARACSGVDTVPRPGTAAKVRRATLCLVNTQRKRAGLRKLKANVALAAAAAAHSEDMVAKAYFAHDGPAGDTFITRAKAAGYLSGNDGAWWLAENLACGPGKRGSARAIVRSWMESPLHRANVLSVSARDVGLGLAAGLPDGTAGGATYTLDLGDVG